MFDHGRVLVNGVSSDIKSCILGRISSYLQLQISFMATQ